MDLKKLIRDVPDFPKKGIVFKDITTLLLHPDAVRDAVEQISARYRSLRVQKVIGIESRGFVLGPMIAQQLNAGFVPIRKKGKLPAATIREEYALEYGTDTIEIHADAIAPGERVLLHDDLLATGGTMAAALKLVQRIGGVPLGASFIVELDFLKGKEKLKPLDVFSLVHYQEE